MINDLCVSQVDHPRGEDKVCPACSRVVHVTVQVTVMLVLILFLYSDAVVCVIMQETERGSRTDENCVRRDEVPDLQETDRF